MNDFIVDTNVLLVAALPEHEDHPVRARARQWLADFHGTYYDRLMLDCPRGTFEYMRHSQIVSEYLNKLDFYSEYFQIIFGKLGRAFGVPVEFEGGNAVVGEDIARLMDPSDRKFAAVGLNYVQWVAPGLRHLYAPTIVYAEDVHDWARCREALELRGLKFLYLGE